MDNPNRKSNIFEKDKNSVVFSDAYKSNTRNKEKKDINPLLSKITLTKSNKSIKSNKTNIYFSSILSYYLRNQYSKVLKLSSKNELEPKHLHFWKIKYIRLLSIVEKIEEYIKFNNNYNVKYNTKYKSKNISGDWGVKNFSKFLNEYSELITKLLSLGSKYNSKAKEDTNSSFTEEENCEYVYDYIDDVKELFISLMLRYIYNVGQYYLSNSNILDAIFFFLFGEKLIRATSEFFISPESLQYASKIFIHLSYICICFDCFDTAKNYINNVLFFSFRELELRLPLYRIVKLNKLKPEVIYSIKKIINNIFISFFYIGVCNENQESEMAWRNYENAEKIFRIIEKFENLNNTDVINTVNNVVDSIGNDTVSAVDIENSKKKKNNNEGINLMKNLLKKIKERSKIKSSLLTFLRLPSSQEQPQSTIPETFEEDPQLRRLEKTKNYIQNIKIRYIDDDDPTLFHFIGEKNRRKGTNMEMKDVVLMRILMGKKFKEVVWNMKKIRLHRLSIGTTEKIQKQIIEIKKEELAKFLKENHKKEEKKFIKRKRNNYYSSLQLNRVNIRQKKDSIFQISSYFDRNDFRNKTESCGARYKNSIIELRKIFFSKDRELSSDNDINNRKYCINKNNSYEDNSDSSVDYLEVSKNIKNKELQKKKEAKEKKYSKSLILSQKNDKKTSENNYNLNLESKGSNLILNEELISEKEDIMNTLNNEYDKLVREVDDKKDLKKEKQSDGNETLEDIYKFKNKSISNYQNQIPINLNASVNQKVYNQKNKNNWKKDKESTSNLIDKQTDATVNTFITPIKQYVKNNSKNMKIRLSKNNNKLYHSYSLNPDNRNKKYLSFNNIVKNESNKIIMKNNINNNIEIPDNKKDNISEIEKNKINNNCLAKNKNNSIKSKSFVFDNKKPALILNKEKDNFRLNLTNEKEENSKNKIKHFFPYNLMLKNASKKNNVKHKYNAYYNTMTINVPMKYDKYIFNKDFRKKIKFLELQFNRELDFQKRLLTTKSKEVFKNDPPEKVNKRNIEIECENFFMKELDENLAKYKSINNKKKLTDNNEENVRKVKEKVINLFKNYNFLPQISRSKRQQIKDNIKLIPSKQNQYMIDSLTGQINDLGIRENKLRNSMNMKKIKE